MVAGKKEDALSGFAEIRLFFILFLVVFFVVGEVAILGNFLLLVFFVFVIIIQIFRDDVQMDGMDLRNFQFGFALWATENLAFLDLIFVDIDFGGAFRAADHGSILRKRLERSAPLGPRPPQSSVLYTGVKSTPSGRAVAMYGSLKKRVYTL
jgi:hypothetical protein